MMLSPTFFAVQISCNYLIPTSHTHVQSRDLLALSWIKGLLSWKYEHRYMRERGIGNSKNILAMLCLRLTHSHFELRCGHLYCNNKLYSTKPR